jgi:hypothetical protein
MRVEHKSVKIDFSRISYGLADKQLTSRGRFFVAARTSRVTIPLRARSATPESPVSLDIRVDERLAATITLTESGWRRAEIELKGARPARVHQIDLRIRERESGSSVEVGDWEIISSPDA